MHSWLQASVGQDGCHVGESASARPEGSVTLSLSTLQTFFALKMSHAPSRTAAWLWEQRATQVFLRQIVAGSPKMRGRAAIFLRAPLPLPAEPVLERFQTLGVEGGEV